MFFAKMAGWQVAAGGENFENAASQKQFWRYCGSKKCIPKNCSIVAGPEPLQAPAAVGENFENTTSLRINFMGFLDSGFNLSKKVAGVCGRRR